MVSVGEFHPKHGVEIHTVSGGAPKNRLQLTGGVPLAAVVATSSSKISTQLSDRLAIYKDDAAAAARFFESLQAALPSVINPEASAKALATKDMGSAPAVPPAPAASGPQKAAENSAPSV